MSIRILKRYQEKAVDELFSRSKKLLSAASQKKEDNLIIFKAPTGAGKTFTMASYMYRMCKDEERQDFCFLWVSIGKGELHKQSYRSIKEELGGFSVSLLEEEFFGSRREIKKDESVVFSWNQLALKHKETGDWKSVLMKDKETVNFRDLIENTKKSGRKIIMIIDESQVNARAERSMEVRDIIDADLTIEVSATPVLLEGSHDSRLVEIEVNDVIEEGMIKKEIIINEKVGTFAGSEKDSQAAVLAAAYAKRLELKKLLSAEDSEVNPLALVQMPSGEEGEKKRHDIEKFLAEKDITIDNGKLAVWLSEEKVNLEVLENNQSEVEFLLFKQAIDTGWDCPRAQILIRLRETHSIVMELQTIGRIMRMPETVHYQNDNLNKAFIYTNIIPADISFRGDDMSVKYAIKSVYVKRDDAYQPLSLRSYYRNRIDYGDLTLSFHSVFEKTACEFFDIKPGVHNKKQNEKALEKKGVILSGGNKKEGIILDKVIPVKLFDNLPHEEFQIEDQLLMNLPESDKEKIFELLIRKNLSPFAPARSMQIFEGALYKWCRLYLGIDRSDLEDIQNIVLNNLEKFDELYARAIRAYIPVKENEVAKKIAEVEEWNNEWEIAESRNYNPEVYRPENYKLSLYKHPGDKKAYLSLDSEIEREFIKFLDSKKDKIAWWWQNGSEHMALNFGIKYEKNGDFREKASTFQPDFLVLYKDGSLGIYDTKGQGDREDENKLKAEALQKYIKEENKRKKKELLRGGIIIRERDRFLLNSDDVYVPFAYSESTVAQSGGKKKAEGWRFFEI